MRRIDALLAEYSDSHRHPANKLIHAVFVPLIFFSIVGLLWSIPFPFGTHRLVNWATLAMAGATLYYLRLSLLLAAGMLVVMAGCILLADRLDGDADRPLWILSLAVFLVSWVFQFVGHRIEGRRPAFLRDLQFLLIGPVWLLHALCRRLDVS